MIAILGMADNRDKRGVDGSSLIPVRLLVAADPGAGFQLTPDPQLPNISPGALCTIEYRPQKSIEICEIVVVGNFTVTLLEHPRLHADTVTTETNGRHLLRPPLVVRAGDCLRLHLRNDDDLPLPPRSCVAVMLHETRSRGPEHPQAAATLHRTALALRTALHTILSNEGDCVRTLEAGSSLKQPCNCTVCIARRALENEEDWRFQGWKPERRTSMPREFAMHAAWRRYFTTTAGPADRTTAPMDLILAKILDVDVDTVSERDWYVATTVIQWLASSVGQCVLFDAGYRQAPSEGRQHKAPK